jgi:replicative DNA helicase
MGHTSVKRNGHRIDLAQRTDHLERIAISYPLWDEYGTHKAALFFAEHLKPEMFTSPEYRTIAQIMTEIIPRVGQPTQGAVMLEYHQRVGKMIDPAIFTADFDNAEALVACDAVITLWQRRELNIMFDTHAKEIAVSSTQVQDVIDLTHKRLTEVAEVGTMRATSAEAIGADLLEEVALWEAGTATAYTPSGFMELDRAIGGFPLSEVVTLGGMTGAGKTALLCNMALLRAKIGKATYIFSAEMTASQMLARIAATQSGINVQKLRFRHDVTASDYERYRKAVNEVRKMPIIIDDTPAPTLPQIESRISSSTLNPQMVFVDYLEKVSVYGEKSEELRVSAIAQGLKTIAKRTGTCIVALSQYARDKEAHKDVPKDSWLRYSGKIEQESALIVHWWWPGYFVVNKGIEESFVHEYDPQHPDLGYLVITKNRHGKACKHALRFQPELMRFHEYESTVHGF